MGEIYIFHNPDAMPEEWRVEEIDSDGDGGINMATVQRSTRRAARQAVCRGASEPEPAELSGARS